ncbi:hypothetical protein DFO68_11462 [Halomonas ventosae]|uniref:SpoVT-AbrB domain-containing protein n=2 Tax=Halomonadaceae TaxID=28256 RepID=A0A4R6H984_9GAMM|nr:AbrB/MazE/SpoVT family DNA-binding domain-containing protein [Halomonas ventosae]TDO04644.1 hypothetical protein DFO68_11462 [Halomonas ventosae]
MMAVPRALLDQLHLHAGSQVEIKVDHGRLIVEPDAFNLAMGTPLVAPITNGSGSLVPVPP